MKHWRVWSIYGLLMAMALLAMALITRSSLVMERAQRASLLNALRARLEIANQQQIVVAARAIDRELVSLVVSESLRSHLDYHRLPAGDWPFNRFVNAYFHIDGRGIIKARTVKNIDPDKLRSLMNSLRWREDLPSPLTGRQASWLTRPAEMYRVNALVNRPLRPPGMNLPFPDQTPETNQPFAVPSVGDLGVTNMFPEKYPQSKGSVARNSILPGVTSVSIGPIYSIWVNEELLFVRRVVVEDQDECRDFLQGCWLEWSLLSTQLLRTVQSGLPAESRLDPVLQQPGAFSGEYVGWVPLKVVTPELNLPTDGMPLQGGWLNLILGWVFMSIAGIAISLLLQTVLREARRRETFVSAVTHELRTPLTAFRLYTDLLAKNPDPEKTRLYAKTLESEAERLSHLVENVLTYSRLEQRGITSHHRVVTVSTLLDAIVPRLDEHCVRNQMLLDYSDAAREIRQREILTDPSAVERILFNLVDNACKYGKSADEATIQLEVLSDERMLSIKVRDFGPGIHAAQKRRLFQAYNHGQISAQTPNKTIGLGLNISLQLATALGGTLTFHDANPGAEFQLDLPWQAPR